MRERGNHGIHTTYGALEQRIRCAHRPGGPLYKTGWQGAAAGLAVDAAPRRGDRSAGPAGPSLGHEFGQRPGRAGLLGAGGTACRPGRRALPCPAGPGRAARGRACPAARGRRRNSCQPAPQAAPAKAGHTASCRPDGGIRGDSLSYARGGKHPGQNPLSCHGLHPADHLR